MAIGWADGEKPVFHVDIILAMVTGRVQGNNEKVVGSHNNEYIT